TLAMRALISTLRAPCSGACGGFVIRYILSREVGSRAGRTARQIHHVRTFARDAHGEAGGFIEARGRRIVGSEPERVEAIGGDLEDPCDQLPPDAVPATRRQHVEVTHPADAGIGRVGVDVEPAHADEPARHQGAEQRLARPVESIGAGGPVVDEPANDAGARRFAVDEQLGEPVGRQLAQRLDGREARFAPAAERLVNRAAAPRHRELRVMTSSTTSNPGGGEGMLLNDTVTEYLGPKSEPVAASISRLVWS